MNWYLSYNGERLGPLSDAQAREHARANPAGLAWREGFTEWVPIARLAELTDAGRETSIPVPPPALPGSADEIDYKISAPKCSSSNSSSIPAKVRWRRAACSAGQCSAERCWAAWGPFSATATRTTADYLFLIRKIAPQLRGDLII